MKKFALISCFDKSGLYELAEALIDAGYSLLASGGSKQFLTKKGFEVTSIEELTKSKEILDSRVKTLHPMVFGGILARRDKPSHLRDIEEMSGVLIDIVVVNLYPFAQEKTIEMVDIGGVSLLRAAAKNYKFVTVISDANDYSLLLPELKNKTISEEFRKKMAAKVFVACSKLDAMIGEWMTQDEPLPKDSNDPNLVAADALPNSWHGMPLRKSLRYGENPHQAAGVYFADENEASLLSKLPLQGKQLSYNNIRDSEAAWRLASEWRNDDNYCAVIVKHCNPCGVAINKNATEAWLRAFEADSESAFGGIVAFNKEVDAACAKKLAEIFLEIVIAPAFSDDALAVLAKKKNLRLLQLGFNSASNFDGIFVGKGLLLQKSDSSIKDQSLWRSVARDPSAKELLALNLAWRVATHAKSNAVVIADEFASKGIGAGVTSRVRATKHAITALANNADKQKLLAAASDGFFPFKDSLELLIEAGVTAVVQPGGSIRDNEVIDLAIKHNIAMMITDERHFKH